jgi:hypothetical protein
VWYWIPRAGVHAAIRKTKHANGCPVRSTRTGRYKFKSNCNGAHLKLAATLRFGTAESQDESPCWAINRVKSLGAALQHARRNLGASDVVTRNLGVLFAVALDEFF